MNEIGIRHFCGTSPVGFWRETDHASEGRVRLMNPPYTLTKSPATIRRDPPRFGEHTRTILAEHGYDADAVERLVAEGAAIDEKAAKT